MSSSTAATKPSSKPSRRGSRRPAGVLLNTAATVGIHGSATTARDRTNNGNTIQVSFCLKRPPQKSTLFVHSSDLNPSVPPEIVCSVDNLLLLRVNMGTGPSCASPKYCDYFIYRADSSRPSLELLQRPHPFFHNSDVGLLPRSDGHYTIAALIATGTNDMYQLHVFHSDTSSWTSSMVSVEAPQEEFPVKLPWNCGRLLNHDTTTVITIGGEGGTMGWVDLWRGILLCDVLHSKPSLRGVPLPLPLTEMSYNNGLGLEFGFPGQRRGIAFIRDKGCLMFVHLEITDVRLPDKDPETGSTAFQVDDWALTTWSNNKMSNSLEDWHKKHVVQASNISITGPAVSRLLKDSGLLLHRPHDNEVATAELRNLQNLSMYQPTPCLSGEDVVYLVARVKYMHPKAWVLAVDMRNGGRLHGVGYFGNQRYCGVSVIYCPSTISKYMNRGKHINPATTSGFYGAEFRDKLLEAIEVLKQAMCNSMANQTANAPTRLTGPIVEEESEKEDEV
uniref:DUF1618 domain-containing protein n=1 Tax=Arundo donax TaxID=35708 RepID=A0A0A9ACX4_ARUDO